MKNLLSFIPGFRSNKTWKKVLASFYYLVAFSSLTDGLGLFLFMIGMPFLVFTLLDVIKAKKSNNISKATIIPLVISLMVTFTGFTIVGLADTDQPIATNTEETDEVQKAEPVKEIKEGSKDLEKENFKQIRDLKVHYIDVGQGDSIFIELPNGQNALIDGGPGSNSHHLIKYLKELEFETIDYLVATHPHEDHIGGLPDVIRGFDIGKIYMPDVTHTTNIFEELITTIQSKDHTIVKTSTGTILLDEPGLSLKALAPDPNTSGSDLNDYSIVLRLDFKENSFMFTGDAETLTEQYLLADNSDEELKVNVLKVGHHGSDTSSIQPFIDKVNPEQAVITCGKGNSYGHPDPSVIARLENANIDIYRTDTDGTIIAIGDGESIAFVKKGNPIEPNAPPMEVKEDNKQEIVQEEKTESKPATPAPSENTNNSGGGQEVTPTPNKQESPTPPEPDVETVLVTPTGKRYHRRACGNGNYTESTLEKAKARGLTPCKKCY